jgi:hypothetical protein
MTKFSHFQTQIICNAIFKMSSLLFQYEDKIQDKHFIKLLLKINSIDFLYQ